MVSIFSSPGAGRGRDVKQSHVARASVFYLQTSKQVRPSSPNRIALFTVCFDGENIEYDPPQLGVVFLEDMEAWFGSPHAYEDGLASFLNPTLYEDYEFPIGAEYPFAIIDNPQARLNPDAGEVASLACALVKELNNSRPAGSPPFLAVNFSGDTNRHLDELTDEALQATGSSAFANAVRNAR